MSVLLLRLAGPLQAWGDRSRFSRRETRTFPTKSGVIGLLAAAQGRRRTDPIEDLTGLRFGVRVDQVGTLVRDFHTAHDERGVAMPLSQRYYLADAVFLAAVEGDPSLILGLDAALRSPVWAPFLGRRSCPPAGPLALGVRDGALETVLRNEPWRASPSYRRRCPARVSLDLVRDATTASETGEVVRDEPIIFDPRHRQHTWRTVVRVAPVLMDNQEATRRNVQHDPFDALDPA